METDRTFNELEDLSMPELFALADRILPSDAEVMAEIEPVIAEANVEIALTERTLKLSRRI